MTFSGDLKEIQLADVFQNIHTNRLTGTLLVRARKGDRYVYFREGLVAGFSLGLNKGLPVVEHLAQRQYVEKDALAAAVKKKSKSRKFLRVVLAGMQALPDEEFRGALAELVDENLYELLMVKEADFSFTEGDPLPRVFDGEQKAAKLALDPSGILMESARRRDEWERIQKVVLSDHDIFVALEGWDQQDISDQLYEVASLLDGRLDIRGLLARLPYSRFAILKAVNDLVQQDLLRPLAVKEIEQMVEEALGADDLEEAVTLLTRALMIERSNQDLRLRLVELFQRLGRAQEAASELALLGYQAAQTGQVEDALAHYEQAVSLNPDDLMLQQRRMDLLRDQDPEAYAAACLDLVDLLLAMGLADRARSNLVKAIELPALKKHVGLLEKLAEVEAQMGHAEAAAELLLRLASFLGKTEDDKRLRYLQQALLHVPEDQALRQRFEDLQTGRAQKRRAMQRRLVSLAATIIVVLGLGTVGIVEINVSNNVLQSLEDSLQAISDGRPAAPVSELEKLEETYGWTAAGRTAGRMVDRLLELQVMQLEGQLAAGEYQIASAGLERLQQEVTKQDFRNRLDALLHRAHRESHAQELFLLVNDRSVPGAMDQEALAQLTDPELLDFHLTRLAATDTTARAKYALLQALYSMNSPRAMPVATRLYLVNHDSQVQLWARKVLEQASQHRLAGREASWASVYPELERARKDEVTKARAEACLVWLRGWLEKEPKSGSGTGPTSSAR